MKLKTLGLVIASIALLFTACGAAPDSVTSDSLLSGAPASESNGVAMKSETIGNETWYHVETEAQLRAIADNDTTLAQNYIQHADITLTSEWISIGEDEHPFTGKYNGNGYVISGLYYPAGEKEYTGLFGYAKGGEMYNITLISPDTANANGTHNGAIVALCLGGGGAHDNAVLDEAPSERQACKAE